MNALKDEDRLEYMNSMVKDFTAFSNFEFLIDNFREFIDSSYFSKEMMSYFSACSPEIFSALLAFERSVCTNKSFVTSNSSEKNQENFLQLTQLFGVLDTIRHFPRKHITIDDTVTMVSVILCGGKGSRMGSQTLHKSCFPINGRPAINRLLEQLESAGITQHVVVIGDKGKQVVDEISELRDNVAFVCQLNQTGTGNAAKQARYLLEAQGYRGDILVVPGDKVIEKSALDRLTGNYRNSGADMAVMTADSRFWPDAGRIVFDDKGRMTDIVEKHDVLRMEVAGELHALLHCNAPCETSHLLALIESRFPREKAHAAFPNLLHFLENNTSIDTNQLESLLPEHNCWYNRQASRYRNAVRYSGAELNTACTVSNASIYLYSSDAFYSSLKQLPKHASHGEEYLTDTVRILADDIAKDRIIIPVPVRDRYEVMSFNNPGELLAIEEYYSAKEASHTVLPDPPGDLSLNDRYKCLRPVGEWISAFDTPDNRLHKRLNEIYGDDRLLKEERRKTILKTLMKFRKIYGVNSHVILARSPGRVNLMGRHVEHRGGYTNYMTIEKEAILVAGIRNDDVIDIHDMESETYRHRQFAIEDELSKLSWDNWISIINSPTHTSRIKACNGDWSNYVKSAALRLQEKYKGRLLFGFNGVYNSNIPPAAGLSSSSALVVSTAEALSFINNLSFVEKDFVDLCGESEWFVGTRGGSGDHAAMKYGGRGTFVHMRFCEIAVEDVIAFPEGCKLMLIQSFQQAKKTGNAKQIFNEKVATYEIALALIKAYFPEYREKLVYFRDINAERLGVDPGRIYEILTMLPETIDRYSVLKNIHDSDRKHIENVFQSHEEPEGGYEARNVAMFGLSEIARAQLFPRLIKNGDIVEAGKLMSISHDGDRVSMLDYNGRRIDYWYSLTDEKMGDCANRIRNGDQSAALYLQPGSYRCSTPLLDGMVDTAMKVDGVLGAQLSGAGLGGCVMVLVRNECVESLRKAMRESFFLKHGISENMLACTPIQGSGVMEI